MRRTIHNDPMRRARMGRSYTKKVLPTNFQWGVESEGKELRARRTSDGRIERMVPVEEYDRIRTELGEAQAALSELQGLKDQLAELQEIVANLV